MLRQISQECQTWMPPTLLASTINVVHNVVKKIMKSNSIFLTSLFFQYFIGLHRLGTYFNSVQDNFLWKFDFYKFFASFCAIILVHEQIPDSFLVRSQWIRFQGSFNLDSQICCPENTNVGKLSLQRFYRVFFGTETKWGLDLKKS